MQEKNNGPITASFCLFSLCLQSNHKWRVNFNFMSRKSVDVVLGIRTCVCRLVSSDGSTVLWRSPSCTNKLDSQLTVSGNGCGSVGRAVASNSRGPGSNPVIGKKLYWSFTVNCFEKTKNKEKEAENCPFLERKLTVSTNPNRVGQFWVQFIALIWDIIAACSLFSSFWKKREL